MVVSRMLYISFTCMVYAVCMSCLYFLPRQGVIGIYERFLYPGSLTVISLV